MPLIVVDSQIQYDPSKYRPKAATQKKIADTFLMPGILSAMDKINSLSTNIKNSAGKNHKWPTSSDVSSFSKKVVTLTSR